MAHATTLTDFRKAVGKTQVEVARELGVKQNAVSQIEKRSDLYISTLRRFLKSAGVTLELAVVTQNGTRINLPNFLLCENANPTAGVSDVSITREAKKAGVKVASVPVRKIAMLKKMAAPTKSTKPTVKRTIKKKLPQIAIILLSLAVKRCGIAPFLKDSF